MRLWWVKQRSLAYVWYRDALYKGIRFANRKRWGWRFRRF